MLLVCATNYIRNLDSALLWPGRFDCIVLVRGLDEESRNAILQYYLAKLNSEKVDLDLIVKLMPRFTSADIEYLY